VLGGQLQSGALLSALNVDASGAYWSGAAAWTGAPGLAAAPGANCQDWNSGLSTNSAIVGQANQIDVGFFDFTTAPCADNDKHLYCLQQ
jgi:hypothetical protein